MSLEEAVKNAVEDLKKELEELKKAREALFREAWGKDHKGDYVTQDIKKVRLYCEIVDRINMTWEKVVRLETALREAGLVKKEGIDELEKEIKEIALELERLK